MGRIELIKGDCLQKMKDIKDCSIDMILCDLPYGTTSCKWDTVIDFEALWEQYNRIIKNNGAIVLFGSEPFSSALRMSNIKNYKYDWKWNKINGGNPLISKYRPMGIFEDIVVFGKGKVNYYPIMEVAKDENKRPRNKGYKKNSDMLSGIKSNEFKTSETHNEDLRYPKNELKYNNRKDELNALNRLHPTQKPVGLLEYLIKTYTVEGDMILDNCMGSGSTGVACLKNHRKFIGIELDEQYYNIAVNRVNGFIYE